jgi:hypothetical protein
MRNVRQTIIMLMAAFALLFLAAGTQVAYADEISCTGTLGAITVDNLRVPSGKTCTLNKTYVKGTIKVENNAKLYAKGVHVVGNVQAENAKVVNVTAKSVVGGSVQIKQSGSAKISKVKITGDILFDDNANYLQATYNTVGGNIQVFQNTGGVKIANNTVDGNLQCKENTPKPTGGNNIVHGNKEDQCAKL